MRALDFLAGEHRLLARVLVCLETLLDQTLRSGHLDSQLATEIVGFLERFADGCHQEKEQEVLFPKLMEQTPAAQGGLIRKLQGAHDDEHALLEELRRHVEEAVRGDDVSVDRFVDRGRAYVKLQREHTEEENTYLLPLAEEFLGRADDAEMIVKFRAIEERHYDREAYDPARAVDVLYARLQPRAAS